MRGTMVVVVVMLVTALAGCSKAPEGGPEGTASMGDPIEAPTWAAGQYWGFKTTNSEGTTGQMFVVVTGSEGSDWLVDTNDAGTAQHDAANDISYLGKVRMSDLAGSQNGQRVQFFDFPLEYNKTWKTTWDGVSVDITVQHVMDNGNVHMMAHTASGMFAEYEYNPEAMFFDYLTFYDENGTEQYKIEKTEQGLAYDGDVLRYTLHEDVTVDTGALATSQTTTTFTGATEIRILLHAFCHSDTAGQILIGMGPTPEDEAVHLPPIPTVAEPAYGLAHDCSKGDMLILDEGVVQIEADEQWYIDVMTGSQNGQAVVVVQPRAVETLSSPFE